VSSKSTLQPYFNLSGLSASNNINHTPYLRIFNEPLSISLNIYGCFTIDIFYINIKPTIFICFHNIQIILNQVKFTFLSLPLFDFFKELFVSEIDKLLNTIFVEKVGDKSLVKFTL